MNWEYLYDTEVWCINLKGREDRYNHSIKEFSKINILNIVNFHHPEKSDHKISSKGCWDSHKFCMEHALNNNKNVLIFEDDVYFDDITIHMYNNIKKYYNKKNWEILRLGCLVFNYGKKINNNLWDGNFSACHAYFIHKNFIKKCIDDEYFDAEKYSFPGIDDYYRFESSNDYSIVPQIAWQAPFKSDNNWFNILKIYQKFFENSYLFKFNQKFMNFISWKIRFFPIYIKKLNPYSILFNICDTLNYYYNNNKIK